MYYNVLKILIYIIVLAPALYYGVYMFNHFRKRSLEIGLTGLVFGTFLIIIGVYKYPADKTDTIILTGFVFMAIAAAMKLFERKEINTKKAAKVKQEEALKKYNELIDQYGSLESKSDRPMNEKEIAKVKRGKMVGKILGVTFALLCLAGAIIVYFLTDNTTYWLLIVGAGISVIGVLINNRLSNERLENKLIYVLKGVITNKFIKEVGKLYNHVLIINKSIYITTSKKLYRSLGFGYIIKAESNDENFNSSYAIVPLGSIMTAEQPQKFIKAE